MNEKYTGDLQGLRSVLPRRKEKKGVAPSMTGKAVNDRSEEGDGEHQWVYPAREPTEKQKRMIVARCCEIGVRTVFENFTYKFGGETFKQMEGGPIGAQPNHVCSQVGHDGVGRDLLQHLDCRRRRTRAT